MDRDKAYEELAVRLENKNHIKHSLAVEAIMKKLAEYFLEDVHQWGLAGLLHDIDYDRTKDALNIHSLVAAEILEGLNLNSTIIYAVKAHNPIHGIERRRRIDKALYSSDPLSGLIIACALVHPDKKISKVDTAFVMKKFNEKNFAKGSNRDQIKACSELGIQLEEFIGTGLAAMQEIHQELGL
jgi:putative nucleotidyltransferase with HDIG domain